MRKRILIAAAAAAAVSLTACSGGSGKDSSAAAVSSDVQAETESITIPTDSAEVTAETPADAAAGDYIEIGEYKGFEIEAGKDTPIEEGMTVNLDFSGTIDGDPFDGGQGEGYDLLIGSHSFIDDFEEQLTGHKEGDTVEVTVTFPKDYGSDELAGKEAVFSCVINRVYKLSPDIAYSQFLESSKVKQYPGDLVDEWTQMYLDMYSTYVTLSVKSPSKEDILGAVGINEEMLDQMVKNNVKEILACEAVMEAEGITRESEEYKNALESFLTKNGCKSEEEAISAGYTEQELRRVASSITVQNLMIRYEKSA